MEIYDKELAHFQISISGTSDLITYEKAPKPTVRIKVIETLEKYGFDTTIRFSPFLYEYVDFKILNNIKCKKILVEFLKVNHWIKKNFNIDYSEYIHNYGSYMNLSLDFKIDMVSKITDYNQISVGEFVPEHHQYFSNTTNFNKKDCCNLDITKRPKINDYKRSELFEV
jgi:DNA repair photolyase